MPMSTQYSEAETEDETPTEIAESDPEDDSREPGLFARLIPLNDAAKSAMEWSRRRSQVEDKDVGRERSREEQDFFVRTQHHAKFIDSCLFEGESCICFKLSLHTLPQFAGLGWRIGKGRANDRHLGVDLLLLPHEGSDGGEIAGLHARLTWRKSLADFFVVADNPRRVGLRLGPDMLRPMLDASNQLLPEARVIPFKNTLSIGNCLFTLLYVQRTERQDVVFQEELRTLFSTFYGEEHPLVLPTPREDDAAMGNWTVRHPINVGAYGKVVMVTHKITGEPAAVKIMWRRTDSAGTSIGIDREVAMARRMMGLSHERIASPLDIIEPRSQSRIFRERIQSILDPTWTPRIQREHLLVLPFLEGTFQDLIVSNVSHPSRIEAIAQLLEGVAFLHANGICHRDIKPANVGITNYSPPRCKVIDFGCASTELQILYDYPGTIPYLAPEQQPLRYHGREVDLWACGIVGAELYGYNHSMRLQLGTSLDAYRAWLKLHIPPHIEKCLNCMVELEPTSRITAKEAVKELAPYRVYDRSTSPQRGKRRRDEEIVT